MIWQKDWLRAILLVALAAASIFISAEFFIANGPVPPGRFSYLQDVPQTGGSVQVTNVNGLVTLSTWTGNRALVNGTITATWVGATPDQVVLGLTNANGMISVSPAYPASIGGRGYMLDLNIFLPIAVNLTSLTVTATTGNVQLSNLNVATASIYTTTGSVSAAFRTVSPSGSYTLSSDQGGISLRVPSTGIFQVSATTYFARIWPSGLNACHQTFTEWDKILHFGELLTADCGGGLASFNVSTHNGDITINRN